MKNKKNKITRKFLASFSFFCVLFFLVITSLVLANGAIAQVGSSEVSGWDPNNYDTTGLPSADVQSIIIGVMNWLLFILEFVAAIAFVISGFQYLTAAGDEDQIETAKNNMKWSLIGVGVGILGLIVVKTADDFLNASPSPVAPPAPAAPPTIYT